MSKNYRRSNIDHAFYNVSYNLGQDEDKALSYCRALNKAGFEATCGYFGETELVKTPSAPFGSEYLPTYEILSRLFKVRVLLEAIKDKKVFRIVMECKTSGIYYRNNYVNTPEFCKDFNKDFSMKVCEAIKNRYFVEIEPIISNPANVAMIVNKEVLYEKDINLGNEDNDDIWKIRLTIM